MQSPLVGARRLTEGTANDQPLYFTSSSLTADDRTLVFISDRDSPVPQAEDPRALANLYAQDRATCDGRRLARVALTPRRLLPIAIFLLATWFWIPLLISSDRNLGTVAQLLAILALWGSIRLRDWLNGAAGFARNLAKTERYCAGTGVLVQIAAVVAYTYSLTQGLQGAMIAGSVLSRATPLAPLSLRQGVCSCTASTCTTGTT